MKITKFVHACLLVEMPAPVNRTALFDPGAMSEEALNVDQLVYLDDIFITHIHGDHFSIDLLKRLTDKFPRVRITAPNEVVQRLAQENIAASSEAPQGVTIFNAPHESVEPLFPQVQNLGIHYLDLLTDPGDSHTFRESKTVLALPIQGPWGSTINAINLALQLKPRYVLPIHDWHWSDAAREQMYDAFEKALAKANIQFIKLKTGEPAVLDV